MSVTPPAGGSQLSSWAAAEARAAAVNEGVSTSQVPQATQETPEENARRDLNTARGNFYNAHQDLMLARGNKSCAIATDAICTTLAVAGFAAGAGFTARGGAKAVSNCTTRLKGVSDTTNQLVDAANAASAAGKRAWAIGGGGGGGSAISGTAVGLFLDSKHNKKITDAEGALHEATGALAREEAKFHAAGYTSEEETPAFHADGYTSEEEAPAFHADGYTSEEETPAPSDTPLSRVNTPAGGNDYSHIARRWGADATTHTS